jgi:Zn-dependent protease
MVTASGILAVIGSLSAVIGSLALSDDLLGSEYHLVGLVLLPLLWIATVAIHEAGHYVGAWRNDMFAFMAQVGPINFLAQQGGWKWRWKWSPRKLHGFVMAFANSRDPFAKQMIWMTLAGPLANLAIGFICVALGVALWPEGLGAFMLGFGTLNLMTGVANLLPCEHVLPSDGLMLIRWLRVKGDDPLLIPTRLAALAIEGATADLLPAAQVAKLLELPEPGPLIHLWFVLKAHQNRLEWRDAAALAPALEQRVSALTPPLVVATNDLVSLMRGEIEFSRLLTGLPAEGSLERHLTSEMKWVSPGLSSRFRAAELAGHGSEEDVRGLLEQSERAFDDSIDAAQRLSEAKIRDAILKRCRAQVGLDAA